MLLNTKPKKYGFTLLELLLAMAIMGILAALIIPPITTLYREKQEISIATQMMLVFKNARKEAINKRINIRIVFDDVARKIQVIETNTNKILNQQLLNNKFQSHIMGIKNKNGKLITGKAFGYNSAGVLYSINGSNSQPITQEENFIFAISMLNKGLDVNNENTKGFLITGAGNSFLCQNKVNAQVTHTCNQHI